MSMNELAEAEELLEEISSWSEDEVKSLPRFYREAAEQYRELLNQGDTELR
ncbi:hypothetical protein [Natrinema marinum]|uniref:hypothetical protein n=1 Tax=Natrinema marinum TaxID=2961598 RepID=UPI0020C8910F|nr:hypothetical protein [Natrinema marinum]